MTKTEIPSKSVYWQSFCVQIVS